MASLISLLSGITATAIVVTGWLAGLRLYFINKRAPSKLLPWAALVLITFGSFYTGTMVYFFYLLGTGAQFTPLYIGAWLCYTVTPLAAASAVYLGCSLFKPSLAKIFFGIFFAIGAVYVVLLWFMPDYAVSVPQPPAGELIDISNENLAKILIAVIILGLFVFLVGGFAFLAKKASGEERKTAIFFAIGFGFFLFAAIGDSLIPEDALLLLIIRLIMLTAFVFLFIAASRMKSK
ncbi:MAG: hypothetical protein RBG13Loki_4374 [Promethearchaeota archaeon CR_4]|nr:MAG: hypothetical protein RBG13Loki_4374 [Candidatus Lokiarchaeota archaeon CR_4]